MVAVTALSCDGRIAVDGHVHKTTLHLWFVATCLVLGGCGGSPHGEAEAGDLDAGVVWIRGELLGRPTARSITVKALAAQSVEVYVEYGDAAGSYSSATKPRAFSDGIVETVIDDLKANARYYYRMRFRRAGSTGPFSAGAEHTFHTQRARTATFGFAIQSDAHLGNPTFNKPELYALSMQTIAAEQPDFLLDLGDAISIDGETEDGATVGDTYLASRAYLEIPGHSSAIFLALGNHEREEGWNLDDFGSNVAASLPVLGANARKRFFVNPVPDTFYRGDAEPLPAIDGDHLRGDYYAFEWGNALFVVIDPYWYTMTKPYPSALAGERDDEVVGARWDWTLGQRQYRWLADTLASSDAKFKMVFAHQEAGGINSYGRGGALGARFCEWGGEDPETGSEAFHSHRPGWGVPIHQLFVQNHVTAFFHGHDHLYATERLDGIVYQAVPMPANANYNVGIDADSGNPEYAGTPLLPNSGHLRVTVAPAAVTVEYVRSFLPGDGEHGTVADSYTM